MNHYLPSDRGGPPDAFQIIQQIEATQTAIETADKGRKDLAEKLATLRASIAGGQQQVDALEALDSNLAGLSAKAVEQLEDLQTRLADHRRRHSSRN